MDTLKILVVDDEPGMRLGVPRALKDLSVHLPDINGEVRFEIAQADSGEKALEMINADPPDILLLDHKMPGMSGLDVLKAISDKHADILTVMITAYASLEVAISATKRGAYDFLAKPFTPEELKGAVRKAAKHIILQRQARKLAEEKRQVRFQFISVLAHELKAPLSAIEGYMHMLLEGAVKEDAMKRRLLERCVARTDGMRKMIMDLLDLTRIESGQKARQLAAVDVAHVARTAVETALPAAKERGITVALHADAPVSMLADAGEIEIILNNLISNAVKYNIEGGKVDVTLAKAEGVVTLTVADTGIGMKPEDAKKLFGEFVRIKNAKTKDILGSGLGLSIVKKLAQLYEGDARVESAPGAGSTFTVTLKDTEQAIG